MRPLSAAAAAVVGTLRGGAPPLAAAAVSASKPSLPANAGPPAPGNGRQCPSAPEPLENSRREGRAGADADPSTSGRPAASWTVGGRGGDSSPCPRRLFRSASPLGGAPGGAWSSADPFGGALHCASVWANLSPRGPAIAAGVAPPAGSGTLGLPGSSSSPRGFATGACGTMPRTSGVRLGPAVRGASRSFSSTAAPLGRTSPGSCPAPRAFGAAAEAEYSHLADEMMEHLYEKIEVCALAGGVFPFLFADAVAWTA